METNNKRRITVYAIDNTDESLTSLENKLSTDTIDLMIVETNLIKNMLAKYSKTSIISLETEVDKIIGMDNYKSERKSYDIEHKSEDILIKFKSMLCCVLIADSIPKLESINTDKGFNLVVILDKIYLQLLTEGLDWKNKIVCSYLEMLQSKLSTSSSYSITYNRISSK